MEIQRRMANQKLQNGRGLDPRVQILILILICIVGVSLSNIKLELACMVLISLTLFWQGMTRTCLKYWAGYALTMALFFFSLQYQSGLTSMLSIICLVFRKGIPVFMFASSIVSRTQIGKLITALQQLRLPGGVIIALAVTIRFFQTLREEGGMVLKAMKMRGIQLSVKNVLLHPVMMIKNLLIPIVRRMSVIAEEMSVASMTRGIDSITHRTPYYENRFGAADAVFAVVFMLVAGVSAAIKGGLL